MKLAELKMFSEDERSNKTHPYNRLSLVPTCTTYS